MTVESSDDLFKIGFANIDHQALGLPELKDGAGRGYKLQADNDLNENEIICLNVSGLVSKCRNPYFVESISFYDIISLTETKLKKK